MLTRFNKTQLEMNVLIEQFQEVFKRDIHQEYRQGDN
jgi:hypothetical protein